MFASGMTAQNIKKYNLAYFKYITIFQKEKGGYTWCNRLTKKN